ncbi:hypothetical protein KAJ61_04690 [Candidatus Parcubacteria bacterium]|nr:hypothetical protein [Candidatus Parcubacteria bacterium]
MQKSLNGLKVPAETQLSISEGLKKAFELKRGTEDVTKQNLEDRKKQLEEKMAILYEDRLNKIVTPEFYQNKFAECASEVESLDVKISLYTKANINFYVFGTKILELADNVGFLYENANPSEKQELLNFLLSNSKLKDKKMLISYKKPFDNIYQRVSRSDMRE